MSCPMSDPTTPASPDAPEPCPKCHKSAQVCVCERIVPQATRVRVLILQHPREQDVELGSARLAALCLERATLAIGLSWASLSHALGETANPKEWVVIYPRNLPKAARDTPPGAPYLPDGKPLTRRKVRGIVVIDGTWAQAKALWWRNPWLLKLGRMQLTSRDPSIYGSLRKEPRREYLSTLEAIADALIDLGEPDAVRTELRRVFRTMVQRARDARRSAARPAQGSSDE